MDGRSRIRAPHRVNKRYNDEPIAAPRVAYCAYCGPATEMATMTFPPTPPPSSNSPDTTSVAHTKSPRRRIQMSSSYGIASELLKSVSSACTWHYFPVNPAIRRCNSLGLNQNCSISRTALQHHARCLMKIQHTTRHVIVHVSPRSG